MNLELRKVKEGGVVFETGRPVTFEYVRNTERAPNFGPRFQQDVEPAGIYMQHAHGFPAELLLGWVRGTILFEHPLVLSFSDPPDDLSSLYGPWSWKGKLVAEYGKKGRALSRALVRAGFDGIVTAWCPHKQRGCSSRELVSLGPFLR